MDSGGHPWITYESISNAYVMKDANTDGTWVTAPGFPYGGIHQMNMGVMEDCALQPLLNSKMAVFCGGGGSSLFYGSLYDSGWQPTQALNLGAAIGGGDSGFQSSAIGDVVYIVFLVYNTPNLFWMTFSASANAFGAYYFLGTSCALCPPSVVLDPSTNNLLAYWSTGGNTYYYSRFNGASWSSPAAAVSLGSAPTCGCGFETSSEAWGGQVEMLFLTGSSSPYSLSFAALPAAVPDAPYSSSPWSKAGLSPYETYFSHFSDYVSPGNGLVAVEAGTLNLPGRGLDFAPSLVFSTPYAFYSDGSPFQYDVYNGASLGNGWALNFPWLGTYYVHLTDGQAVPYSWSGQTFTHHGTTDFVLTQNSGAYTLTMPSGTAYQFDSSKRLSSITDRTGNNAVSFTFGSNNYLSRVTDTVGRPVTFSYNAYNQLASIASGGRT